MLVLGNLQIKSWHFGRLEYFFRINSSDQLLPNCFRLKVISMSSNQCSLMLSVNHLMLLQHFGGETSVFDQELLHMVEASPNSQIIREANGELRFKTGVLSTDNNAVCYNMMRSNISVQSTVKARYQETSSDEKVSLHPSIQKEKTSYPYYANPIKCDRTHLTELWISLWDSHSRNSLKASFIKSLSSDITILTEVWNPNELKIKKLEENKKFIL